MNVVKSYARVLQKLFVMLGIFVGMSYQMPTNIGLIRGGGEAFRSGCVWNRGYGKVFYFQPGHETNRSYFHPEVRKIIQNAVHYLAQQEIRREK